jgi:hypothetical protein
MTRRSLSVLVLLLGVTACSSGSDAKGPTASVGAPKTTGSTTTTTATPQTPEQEVEAAYLKSWDVYAKAMRTLDPAGLDDAYSGSALSLREDEVRRLKTAGMPVRIDVEHHYSINVFDGARQALVLDSYRNHSVLLNAETGQPTEPDPNETLSRRYQLEEVDGSWKVVHVFDAG